MQSAHAGTDVDLAAAPAQTQQAPPPGAKKLLDPPGVPCRRPIAWIRTREIRPNLPYVDDLAMAVDARNDSASRVDDVRIPGTSVDRAM